MNDFIDWMEQEYGEFGLMALSVACVIFGVFAIGIILIATDGFAVLAIPAYLAWVVYRYITRETGK